MTRSRLLSLRVAQSSFTRLSGSVIGTYTQHHRDTMYTTAILSPSFCEASFFSPKSHQVRCVIGLYPRTVSKLFHWPALLRRYIRTEMKIQGDPVLDPGTSVSKTNKCENFIVELHQERCIKVHTYVRPRWIQSRMLFSTNRSWAEIHRFLYSRSGKYISDPVFFADALEIIAMTASIPITTLFCGWSLAYEFCRSGMRDSSSSDNLFFFVSLIYILYLFRIPVPLFPLLSFCGVDIAKEMLMIGEKCNHTYMKPSL